MRPFRHAAPTTLILAAALTVAAVPLASAQSSVTVDTVAEGLQHPWGLAFLPDGRMLVTERPGRLRVVAADGTLSEPLTGLPDVFAQGQGGLLDVALDPDFSSNSRIFLSFAEAGDGGAGTAVMRGTLTDTALENVEVIFRQEPKVSGGNHFGSRLVFAPDGMLFVSTGDRNHRDEAQNLDSHIGKLLRITPDGGVPDDNPFVGRDGAKPEIWSYGHRNIQSAARHPETGAIWTVEHGPRGGDAIHAPEAGKNYGWPIITYGREYSGQPVGQGLTEHEGMEQPIYYWTPSIAPSGMAFYTGDLFPDWKGDVIVGALAGQLISRLDIENGQVVEEHRLLEDLGERIRDVREGPDGALYLLTDSQQGRILRVTPGD